MIKASNLPKAAFKKILEIVGEDSVSLKDLDRLSYSRDSNFKSTIRMTYGEWETLPDIIVWPQTTEQVRDLIRVALRHKIPVVPYGSGSGVCGGTLPINGGMIIDLKRMRKLKLDPDHLLVEAECGIQGVPLEDELNRKGYTLGHFPSSILCAGLGGYLAARSAGQLSNLYGKIEDMVRTMEIVTGRGDIIQTRDVNNSSGVDLNQIFVGSEGTLGILTKATLRVYPLAEKTLFRAIRFPNIQAGMEAIRRFMQAGLKPAVVRLYDEFDSVFLLSHKQGKSKIQYPDFVKHLAHSVKFKSLRGALVLPSFFQELTKVIPTGCLLILMHEGYEKIINEERKYVTQICLDVGGENLGEELGHHWHEHRYDVSYQASHLFYAGVFTDTIEVATTWDNLHRLYTGMIRALQSKCLVMAHLSHAYNDGCSIYFTFLAPLKGSKKSLAIYDQIWDIAMKTCQKLDSVISHHHGIGRLKAKFIGDEWGPGGVGLFQKIKKYYDPEGIMNPGKLFLLPEIKKVKK